MFRPQSGILVVVLIVGLHSYGHAENYVAVGGGMALADLETTNAGNIDLQNNVFFGAKFGHYVNSRQFNWLGWEVDLYRAQPNVKQQTISGSTNPTISGDIPGSVFAVYSAAFNALVRLTGYQSKIEPYVGIGIGLNIGNISGGNFPPEASFAPSFNILAGTRYYVTPNIAPFIEYKYNFAQFNFSRSDITADYRANLFMFGIAFHFGG
ncbi:MAG: hypothetical protein ABW047_10000 [Nitrospiraceae bacterium]